MIGFIVSVKKTNRSLLLGRVLASPRSPEGRETWERWACFFRAFSEVFLLCAWGFGAHPNQPPAPWSPRGDGTVVTPCLGEGLEVAGHRGLVQPGRTLSFSALQTMRAFCGHRDVACDGIRLRAEVFSLGDNEKTLEMLEGEKWKSRVLLSSSKEEDSQCQAGRQKGRSI